MNHGSPVVIFEAGKANVMVATSVAEEGIDIPSCNLVVRMEPAQTVIQFVQARGRARYKTSHYVTGTGGS